MSNAPGDESAQFRTNDYGQGQPTWPYPPQSPSGQMSPYPGQPAYPMQRVQPHSAVLAVVASFFIPGLGSMINNKVGKGLGILACYVVAIVSVFFIIGGLLSPAVWIWGMVAAYNDVRRWNSAHGVIS